MNFASAVLLQTGANSAATLVVFIAMIVFFLGYCLVHFVPQRTSTIGDAVAIAAGIVGVALLVALLAG